LVVVSVVAPALDAEARPINDAAPNALAAARARTVRTVGRFMSAAPLLVEAGSGVEPDATEGRPVVVDTCI
jgi:hypothetical protein